MLHFLRNASRPPIATDDVALASLTRDLEAVFTTLYTPPGRPPAYNWAAAGIANRVVPTTTTGLRSRSWRLTGSLVAGVAALVLTAAGYAAVSGSGLVDRMFGNFGDTPSHEGSHLIGLSETIGGITVTVDHVVFDGTLTEERSTDGSVVEYVPLMVQFTVSGLSGDAPAYSVGEESLSSGGLELRRIGGVGLRGHSDVLARELPPGTEQMLYAYDATGMVSESGSLPLRFEVTVTRRGDQGSQAIGHETPGLRTPAVEPIGTPTRFSFEFSVPTN
jgi:hypothetical protein